MEITNTISVGAVSAIRAKCLNYVQLVKLRLSLLVVFSASMAYLWSANRHVDPLVIWELSIGGFLITGTANIINQVLERKSDKLMRRTSDRPLPGKRMKVNEALLLGLVLGVSGLFVLSRINMLSAALGLGAMVLYACMYTPLKKISWLTVIPGAIAGSIPVVIGCIAARGTITREALILFAIQFLWQFPHTWSIAWLLNDEYNKAGLKMLPTTVKNGTSAGIILFSTFMVIPSGLLLYMYESAGFPVSLIIALMGVMMMLFALRFYRLRTDLSLIHI